MYNFSIIIPLYNESKRLPNLILKLSEYLKNFKYNYELILVDDGSKDDTLEIIKSFQQTNKKIKIVSGPHIGQFHSIIKGIENAEYEYSIILEGDLSADPKYLSQMIECLPSYDLVTGSRYLKGSNVSHKSISRDLLSKIFIVLFVILFKSKLTDPQFSFKIYKNTYFLDIAKYLLSRSDGMKSTEMMLYHEAYGYRIKEISIDYSFVESDRNLPKGKIFYTLKTATLGLLDVWKSCKRKYKDNNFKKKVTRFNFL